MTAELNEKRLKSACKMFREKQNEKFAREQAAKDLNVLYGVVDKSVMTYHQGEFTCFYLSRNDRNFCYPRTALPHCTLFWCKYQQTLYKKFEYMAIHLFCQFSSVFIGCSWVLAIIAGQWPIKTLKYCKKWSALKFIH